MEIYTKVIIEGTEYFTKEIDKNSVSPVLYNKAGEVIGCYYKIARYGKDTKKVVLLKSPAEIMQAYNKAYNQNALVTNR